MKYLLVMLVGLEVLDGWLTYALVRSGAGREANPFLQPIVTEVDFFYLKISSGILAVFLLWNVYLRWPKAAVVCAFSFVIFYTIIVAGNLRIYLA